MRNQLHYEVISKRPRLKKSAFAMSLFGGWLVGVWTAADIVDRLELLRNGHHGNGFVGVFVGLLALVPIIICAVIAWRFIGSAWWGAAISASAVLITLAIGLFILR